MSEEENVLKLKSPALAWVSLALAVVAWLTLLYSNGYFALALGVAGVVCGFIGMPGRSTGIRRMAVTAIVASMVLVVVLMAFITVYKVVLDV